MPSKRELLGRSRWRFLCDPAMPSSYLRSRLCLARRQRMPAGRYAHCTESGRSSADTRPLPQSLTAISPQAPQTGLFTRESNLLMGALVYRPLTGYPVCSQSQLSLATYVLISNLRIGLSEGAGNCQPLRQPRVNAQAHGFNTYS